MTMVCSNINLDSIELALIIIFTSVSTLVLAKNSIHDAFDKVLFQNSR